jgi:hypothetical protein
MWLSISQFDFLGKDSIRYFNTVEVEEKVYKAIGQFKKGICGAASELCSTIF